MLSRITLPEEACVGPPTPRTQRCSACFPGQLSRSPCALLMNVALLAGLLLFTAAPATASEQVKPSKLYKQARSLTKRGLVYEAVRHLENAAKLRPKSKKFQKALTEAKTQASARALQTAAERATHNLDDSKQWLERSLEHSPENFVAAEKLKQLNETIKTTQARLDRARTALLRGDTLNAEVELELARQYEARIPTLAPQFSETKHILAITKEANQVIQNWTEHRDTLIAVQDARQLQDRDLESPYVRNSLSTLGDSIVKYAFHSLASTPTPRPIEIVSALTLVDTVLSLRPSDANLLMLRAAKVDSLAELLLSSQTYLPDPSASPASARVVSDVLIATRPWLGDHPAHAKLSRAVTPLASLRTTITVDPSPNCLSELNTATIENALRNSSSDPGHSIAFQKHITLNIVISDLTCTKTDIPRSDLQDVNSTYVAGYNQIQNPTYIQLRDELTYSMQELQTATYEYQTNPTFASGLVLGMTRGKVNRLRQALAATPPTMEQEIVQQYQYQRFEALRSYAVTSSVGLGTPDGKGWLTKDVSAAAKSRSAGVAGVLPADKSGTTNAEPRVKSIEELAGESMEDFQVKLAASIKEILAGYFVLVSKNPDLHGIDRLAAAMHLVDVAGGTSYEASAGEIKATVLQTALAGTSNDLARFRLPKDVSLPEVLAVKTAMPAGHVPVGQDSMIGEVLKSVVLIETDTGSRASGFFVSHNCLVVTNQHVIDEAETIVLKTYDRQLLLGQVLTDDKARDLALLTTNANESCSFLHLGSLRTGRIGEDIFVMGSPLGLSGSVTKGIISGLRTDQDGIEYLQVDAAVNPGNSGGPVIDRKGEVLGVTTFALRETEGLNFAVAVSELSHAFGRFFN